jgi:transcriptional regulator with XRE-family HTH domain
MYGSFLRDVRLSRGLTQAELAAIAGVAQSNVSAYETERRTPSIDTLNKLGVACGFQLSAVAGDTKVWCPLPHADWLAGDGPPPRDPDDPPDEPSTVTRDTPIEDRVRIIEAVLALADATTP